MLTGAEPRVRSSKSLEFSKNDFLKQFREAVDYTDWSETVRVKVIRFIVFFFFFKDDDRSGFPAIRKVSEVKANREEGH